MPLSVLVIDDDPSFRTVVARMVRRWGHDVEEAQDCAEGVARAEALRPDAVLVDVGLPDGDGLQLAARLATMAWRPLIVIVSSDADVTDRPTALRLGAAGFIPKTELSDGALRALLEGGADPTR